VNVSLVTPAARGSRSGNRVTAVRWARILRDLGHRVRVSEAFDGAGADVLVAVHAYRSAASVTEFRQRFPQRPVVVLLAGTDVYRFQHSHPVETVACMQAADRLVGLHDRVARDVPAGLAGRVRVIHQSAAPLPGPRRPSLRHVDVCVVGHLREEKDPMRAALAARRLPAASRVRIVHLGRAHDARHAQAAREEMASNPRYLWRGEVGRGEVRRAFAHCHAMVISSRMEGGANVVSEAVVADLPVLASHVPGNVGLLGGRHPAYYPVGDERALAALLARVEGEPAFPERVRESQARRAPLFDPRRERAAWEALLRELG